MISIVWFRRDLRVTDHPALAAAAEDGRVLPVFVRDPGLPAGPAPRRRLEASLAALGRATEGALIVRDGRPQEVLQDVAAQVRADRVHATAAITPHGRNREAAVAERLGRRGIPLILSGTDYAVNPGTLHNVSGTNYRVFTPFERAWRAHGTPPPHPVPRVRWLHAPHGDALASADTPEAERSGEAAGRARWREFLDRDVAGYARERDRPDLDATSRMSAHLAMGEVHPRTLLSDLAVHPQGAGEGARRFIAELAWREFCADVLWHNPDSAWSDLRPELAALELDDAGPEVRDWRDGRTGYPFVDAGMRQLLARSWMHNRVRMVTASFLVKDLHVPWQVGARHFLDQLQDGDLASNNHNWQWVAGTGTDAAPYFRIFNPVRQGLRFDPDGRYVRRWVPELAHLPGSAAHEPWRHPSGYAFGYPRRIIDHDRERRETLARYQRAAGRT